MTEWRTVVSSSGVKAHAFRGAAALCSSAATRGYQRAPVPTDRRCGLCERVLAAEAKRREDVQTRLPV